MYNNRWTVVKTGKKERSHYTTVIQPLSCAVQVKWLAVSSIPVYLAGGRSALTDPARHWSGVRAARSSMFILSVMRGHRTARCTCGGTLRFAICEFCSRCLGQTSGTALLVSPSVGRLHVTLRRGKLQALGACGLQRKRLT